MGYLRAGIVRASSVFPILSTCLLMLGGLCVGVGRVYSKTNNVLLSAGILFVAAGEQSRKSRALGMNTGRAMELMLCFISGAIIKRVRTFIQHIPQVMSTR